MESATDSPALITWIREVAGLQDPRVGATTPVTRMLMPSVATRPHRLEHSKVFICGGVVVKIHEAGTKKSDLTARLQCIESDEMDRLWLLPLIPVPLNAPKGRLGTLWPRVSVVSSIENPPWGDAAGLLAKLHAANPKKCPKLPVHGGLARLERAVQTARSITTEQWQEALAGQSLLNRLPNDPTKWLVTTGNDLLGSLRSPELKTLVHGSWHLGQLGHPLLNKRWRLIDPDDLGIGDPAWDLARPAALYLCGLLDEESWNAFVSAYRDASGVGIQPTGEYWTSLQSVARATVLMSAVHALVSPGAHRRETAAAFVATLL